MSPSAAITHAWRRCGRRWSRSWPRGPGGRQRRRVGFWPWWRTGSRASEAWWGDPAHSGCPRWGVVEAPRQLSPSCWSHRRPARHTQSRSYRDWMEKEDIYFHAFIDDVIYTRSTWSFFNELITVKYNNIQLLRKKYFQHFY